MKWLRGAWSGFLDLVGYDSNEPPPPITMAEYDQAVRQGDQLFWPGRRMANVIDLTDEWEADKIASFGSSVSPTDHITPPTTRAGPC